MKQVTIPAQWLQELIALCGPEDHELRERVMKSAAPAPVDALATGGQAQELADTVQTVFDALQDKIDARGPISKGNLQYYVNLLREAFDAAPQAQADARDADTFEQRMSDWSQEDAIDAERYRFIVEHKLILSGGTEKFGWPIAPFGVECHRYIDAARAAIAAAKGE